jgi:acetoin utilization deacetylase AcuC-like enzyme
MGTPPRQESVGCGAGVGYSINVPWGAAGAADAEYLAAFTQVLLPVS